MPSSHSFLVALREQVLLGDGAMGTELFARGVPPHQGVERLNLLAPDLVRQIHADYVAAGSRVIETNTFAANRLALARHGADDQLREVLLAGVQVARAAAPASVFVAGALGPLPADPDGVPLATTDQVTYFTEALAALLDGGVDLLLFESFTDLEELCTAVAVARALTDLPVVAQLAFGEDGVTSHGVTAATALMRCAAVGADVVGANCGQGVPAVRAALRQMAPTTLPLSAYLNAGFPEEVEGRLLYQASDAYLAQRAGTLLPYGVRLLGGCCGTRPATIRALAAMLAEGQRVRVTVTEAWETAPSPPLPAVAEIASPLDAPFPLLVELDTPAKGTLAPTLACARAVLDAGATGLTLADNPLASARADACQVAHLLQAACEAPVIPHLTGRDRNRIALHSSLLGAYLAGIRAVLCITGDPIRMCQLPQTTGVFDVTSVGLVRMVAEYNEAMVVDDPARRPWSIGVALNPNVRTISGQVDRLRRKVDAGAHFALTQPIYDIERYLRLREALAEADLTIPVFVGLLPLVSARHAEFLHNEVPGILIPEPIRERMARHPEQRDQQQAGQEMLRTLLEQMLPHVPGLYGICPRMNHHLLTPLLMQAREAAHTGSAGF